MAASSFRTSYVPLNKQEDFIGGMQARLSPACDLSLAAELGHLVPAAFNTACDDGHAYAAHLALVCADLNRSPIVAAEVFGLATLHTCVL